jgi:GNAT superfamily N-acetyltransferase
MLQQIFLTNDIHKANQMLIDYQQWLLDYNLLFKNFVPEINQLDKYYASNELWGFYHRNNLLGIVATVIHEPDTIELKRFSLAEPYRNIGLESYFMLGILHRLQKNGGIKKARLEVFDFMESEIKISQNLGFIEIEPYKENVLGEMRFFEKEINF